jgi:uncharacterized membrane protein
MKLEKSEVKESLVKSVIYRLITLVLGTLTAYVFTGSIAVATGTALLTETVQAVNYFAYELIWSHRARKKIEQELLLKMKKREIDLLIDYDSIKEIAFELSIVDTFVPKLYITVLNFFKRLLENEQLHEIHDEITKYKSNFEALHSRRKLYFQKNE